MRGRLFPSLDGNLNYLILRYLPPLDLCMARAVCKDWWTIVPKQRLTWQKDFCGTLADYDGQDYVAEVEQRTSFEKDLDDVWFDNSIIELQDKGAAHSLMLFWRLIRSDIMDITALSISCKTVASWNTILLPILTSNENYCADIFWESVFQYEFSFMDWMFQRRLIEFKDCYFRFGCCITFKELTRDCLKGLNHLYKKHGPPKYFWISLMDRLWKDDTPEDDYEIERFITLVEMCGFVSEKACQNALTEQHLRFNHICGCEKVISFKKRKT